MSALAEKIRACAEQGMSQKQTAEALSRSHGLISRASKRHGIKLPPHPVEERKAVENYRAAAAAGMTRTETAIKFGVTYQSVYGVSKKHGIKFQIGERKRRLPILGPLMSQIDPAHLAWLQSQTPTGATLADTIRAIITDAYLDAQEARA